MENLNGNRHGNWDDMWIFGTPVFIYNNGKYRGMAQTETADFLTTYQVTYSLNS